MSRIQFAATLIAIALLAGCGSQYQPEVAYSRAPASELKKSAFGDIASDIPAESQNGAFAGAPPVKLVSRANLKIIYSARIEVIVKDLKAATGKLKSAIQTSGGFIASDDIHEQTGATRSGHWRIRVPTDQFEPLRDAILEIGEPVQNKADSEDVTDQYFDLEGRIKNKKTEQEAIRRYLEDKKITAKLEEIVSVERELSRISGELEQLEGTMRRLQDRTSLATIEVNFREIRDYVPPQTPTFANRISAAFGNSLADLKIAGENFLIGAAAAAPWLLLLLVLSLPVLWMARRLWRIALKALPTTTNISQAEIPRGP